VFFFTAQTLTHSLRKLSAVTPPRERRKLIRSERLHKHIFIPVPPVTAPRGLVDRHPASLIYLRFLASHDAPSSPTRSCDCSLWAQEAKANPAGLHMEDTWDPQLSEFREPRCVTRPYFSLRGQRVETSSFKHNTGRGKKVKARELNWQNSRWNLSVM